MHYFFALTFVLSSSVLAATSDCEQRWKDYVKSPLEDSYKSLKGKCDENLKSVIAKNTDLGYDKEFNV